MRAYNYSTEDMTKLLAIKAKIVDSCTLCSGDGYLIEEKTGDDTPCTCMLIFKYIKELFISAIPRDYWTLELDKLQIKDVYKKVLHTYLDNFETALEKGLGFLFLGPNGSGKTALLAEIGKEAVIDGKVAFYLTTEKYLKAMRGEPDGELQSRLSNSNVVLLDEIDKAYFKEGSSFGPKMVEGLVRDCFTNNTILCIATNMDEEGLTEVFGDSMLSMLHRHLKFVPVSGDDYSEKLQEGWMENLKTKFDFNNSVIKKSALRRKERNPDEY